MLNFLMAEDKAIKILFLAASPRDMDKLALFEELDGVRQILKRAPFRKRFILEQEWAVQADELQDHLLDHRPNILHFSRHGSKSGGIYLETVTGDRQLVRGDGDFETSPKLGNSAIAELIGLIGDEISCVVLNACYTEPLAQAIIEHVEYVVGMGRAITDDAAIAFSKGFYRGLGQGFDVEKAYRLGCNQINIHNLREEQTPKFLKGNLKRRDEAERTVEQPEPSPIIIREVVEEAKVEKPKLHLPPWASESGEDDYGVWATLVYKGERQKFRYIKAGEFLMGSQADEPERYDNETQHKVRLSKDYWLADTACTQGLWEAVMGNNPSYFKGSKNLPVERVSWHDVKGFIEKLNSEGKNWAFRLPTEAEWEYGCRAGTETPFWYGKVINSSQVNFNGNYPYNNSPKSEYRGKTVEVGSLPANSWGLYEMHGNVWEWCEDWYDKYDNKSVQIDPQGLTNGRLPRVIRGGSWSSYAGSVVLPAAAAARPTARSSLAAFSQVIKS
ncbi:MAG: SUMF1/EgtB/PvdO family nonheme iron enzyme [Deinococcales bacterium]